MSTWHIGVIFSSVFLGLFVFLEYSVRRVNANREITRRIAHVLSSLFGLAMGIVLDETTFIVMCLFFLAVITVSFSTRYFSFIHNVRRKTYGELLLPLGILLTYLVAQDTTQIFSVSVLILAIADPIAGIVGDLSYRVYALRTSVFYILALSVLLIMFPPSQYGVALLVALIITIVERLSPYGTDNLTIPFSCSVLLKLLLQS